MNKVMIYFASRFLVSSMCSYVGGTLFLGLFGKIGSPVFETGSPGFVHDFQCQNRFANCITLVKTIQIHMWNIQFGVQMAFIKFLLEKKDDLVSKTR